MIKKSCKWKQKPVSTYNILTQILSNCFTKCKHIDNIHEADNVILQ